MMNCPYCNAKQTCDVIFICGTVEVKPMVCQECYDKCMNTPALNTTNPVKVKVKEISLPPSPPPEREFPKNEYIKENKDKPTPGYDE